MQCVHFLRPDPMTTLEPLGTEYGRAVPVVFAADNNYVPMLATTIYSMLKNASTNRSYDVIVLERDITDVKQAVYGTVFPHSSRTPQSASST